MTLELIRWPQISNLPRQYKITANMKAVSEQDENQNEDEDKFVIEEYRVRRESTVLVVIRLEVIGFCDCEEYDLDKLVTVVRNEVFPAKLLMLLKNLKCCFNSKTMTTRDADQNFRGHRATPE